MLAMQIRDDGRGGVQAEGNGLSGMRERVAALGAACRYSPQRVRARD